MNHAQTCSRKNRAGPFTWAGLVFLSVIGLALLSGCGRVTDEPVPAPDTSAVPGDVAVRIERAKAEVERSLNSSEAWGNYGMVLNAFEFLDEALVCFRRAEKVDPANPRWPYFAFRLLLPNDPDAAESALRRAVELCGNEPEAPRYRLAKILGETGKWQEAQTHAETLVNARPSFAPAKLILAQVAAERGELAKAEVLARECVSDARTRKTAWAFLASVQGRMAKRGVAAESAQQASAAPVDQLVSDPFEEEINALRNDLMPLANQAHALLAARKLDDASAVINQLVEHHAASADTWLVLGRLRLLQNDLPKAEEALRKHLEIDSRSIQGWFQLGMVQLNGQHFEKAAETFQRATELKQDFGPAWYNRGYALGRSGKMEEAAKAFREAIRYNPERFDSYLLLADLELRAGRKSEADRLLAQAERLAPGDRRVASLREKIVKARETNAPR